MSQFAKSLFIAGLFSVAGCGSLDAHCDFRAPPKSSARCQERLGSAGAFAFKQTCGAAGGTAGDGACPREEIVAGCDIGTQGDGSHVVDWYYAPKTMQDVMSACMSDSGTLLPKP